MIYFSLDMKYGIEFGMFKFQSFFDFYLIKLVYNILKYLYDIENKLICVKLIFDN